MAINLWKLGGQPTSYNPLPQAYTTNKVVLGIGEFIFTFKAKSDNNGSVLIQTEGGIDTNITTSLTTTLKSYTVNVISKKQQNLWVRANNGDVQIENIELVQKPLPKLTINGIDGFLSGKWNLHVNAKVIDDETLELNATANGQNSYLDVPLVIGQTYTISCIADKFAVYRLTSGTQGSSYANYAVPKPATFVADTPFARVYMSNDTLGAGKFTFKRPMLNLGSIPAPYEKKKGERMVLPVPRKNLFDGQFEDGQINGTTGLKVADVSRFRTVNAIKVLPNKSYVFSGETVLDIALFYDSAFNFISFSDKNPLTTPPNAQYMMARFLYNANIKGKSGTLQLEEGTTATPYEPYAVQVNKKPTRRVTSRTGLRFEGDSYLQLPSMTMDAIEVDCLIDSTNSGLGVVFDARPGLDTANGFVRLNQADGYSSLLKGLLVDGTSYPKNQLLPTGSRKKYKFDTVAFTDDVRLFASNSATSFIKGTLYRVTCYLNGQVVAQYDFENPNNIVGDKVLQSANINVNKVSKNIFDKTKSTLGKYINVTGWLADSGTSDVSDYMPVEAGASYIVTGYANGANTPYAWFDDRKGEVSLSGGTAVWEAIVAPAGAKYLRITVPKANTDTFMVEKGTVRTAYEPYYKVVENLVPNLKNLIPSFEDARWSLHGNFKVLGKNVGRLDATNAWQRTQIVFPSKANDKFYLDFSGNGFIQVEELDENKQFVAYVKPWNMSSKSFTVLNSTAKFIQCVLINNVVGTFDFIKPQLYELTGKEAMIVGKPIPQRKASKRSLYAKR